MLQVPSISLVLRIARAEAERRRANMSKEGGPKELYVTLICTEPVPTVPHNTSPVSRFLASNSQTVGR